jgi:predicted amidohydrolase YtcJ
MGKHVVVANSIALARAGINASTPDPDGGRIERDNEGEPTGVLHERGKLTLDTTRADTVVPPLSDQQRVDALEIGIRGLHRYGVTSLHEIVRTPEEFADYSRLREAGRLDVRVVGYLRVVEARATLDGVLGAGLRTGFGDEWIRLGGVKVSVDGACTFRNAAVYEPYLGEPENLGILRIEADELREVVSRADQGGLQVAVHAIGPRAVDMALDAFAAVVPADGSNPLRHRIEHGYVAPVHDRLARMARLGLLLSTQPAFIHSVGDTWFDVFPPELVQAMMPLRAALDAGLTVLANSDCPSAPPSPLLGIQAAVGRRTESGRVIGADEAVTVSEAIGMYTAAPAYAAREEHSRGSIAVGRLADLVVLGNDPREVDVTEIADVPVLATMVGGQLMYRHESV